MPETKPKTDTPHPTRLLFALIGRNKTTADLPEKLAHRMKRMEHDLSRRLPERGFLKP